MKSDHLEKSTYDHDRSVFGEKYDKTTIDEWPFSANLQKTCSAVIIGADIMLTSAFCCNNIPKNDVSNWRMHMGGTKAIGKFRVRIKSVHIHPRYKNENGIKCFDMGVWALHYYGPILDFLTSSVHIPQMRHDEENYPGANKTWQ